jgi:AraC-like DNA-binding protein
LQEAPAVSEPTIAAGVARALLDLATARGADRRTLLRRARIAEADLQDREGRLPFARYVALMRAGQELCGDPALALHFGESVPMSELSIGLAAGGHSQDIAESLALTNRYAPLVVEVDSAPAGRRFELISEGERTWLVDTRPRPNDFPELTESTFARIVCMVRSMLGERYVLHEVHVTHAEPAHRAEYDRIFRAPVFFGGARNALLTNAAWLSASTPMASRPVFELLKARSEELLARLERSKSFRARVEAALLPELHTGEAGIAGVARALGLSRQTLFRRLKAEGVTFEQVLDRLRHRLALEYLKAPGASVNGTAYMLGFSEPAAFSRAFKRWTGASPVEVLRGREVRPPDGPVTGS